MKKLQKPYEPMLEWEYEVNSDDYPQTMTCPVCGRTMRYNYSFWKEPRYVCDSYREESDCGMVLLLRKQSETDERLIRQ